LFESLKAQRDLTAAGEQDYFRFAIGVVGQNIRSASDAGYRSVFCTIDGRQCLTAQNNRGRFMVKLHDDAPRLKRLVRVSGA
jgi:hypothetical protein